MTDGNPTPPKRATAPAHAARPKQRARREPGKAKVGSPKAAKTEARRAALRVAIRKHGLSNLNVEAFAKRQGVAPKTIYEDLKGVAAEVGKRGAEVIVLSALENLRRAKEEYLAILKESKGTRTMTTSNGEDAEVPAIADSVRLGAAKALMESAKAEIDALQRLGLLKGDAAAMGSPGNPVTVKVFGFDPSAYTKTEGPE